MISAVANINSVTVEAGINNINLSAGINNVTAEATINSTGATAEFVTTNITASAELKIILVKEMRFIWGTLPTSGTDILDADGESVGTWVSVSEINIPVLNNYPISDYKVFVDENPLRWRNADDSFNDLDDSLTTGGTVILFSGRELFQRGAEICVILKT